MFWRTYGPVIGAMFVVGIVVAGLFLFVLFAWLLPPDRGEESALLLTPLYGGIFGALTAAAASLPYGVCMPLWTRRPGRSVASRAWVGGTAAALGALAFWIVVGYAFSGAFGLLVWGQIGGVSAALALFVAGSLTARAAIRGDTRSQMRAGDAVL